MKKRYALLWVWMAIHLVSCGLFLTETPDEKEILDGPIQGLTTAQMSLFLKGDGEFSRRFTPADGLGPVFNNVSCVSCHNADGKGHPSTALTRFGVGNSDDSKKFDYLLEWGGPQLQEKSIPGYVAEKLPKIENLKTSVRTGPIVTGLGLIENIPDSEILKNADPNDLDQDGISGRPNYVTPPSWFEPTIQHIDQQGKIIGRFGRKATAINLLHQVVNAYFNDMGITTDFIAQDVYNPLVGTHTGDSVTDPEIPSEVVRSVVFYMQTLRPPSRRNEQDPQVLEGQKIFQQIQCAKCHIPSMKTGFSSVSPLSYQEVHLYSDLLLHDMGDRLADGFPEGSATGKEWRTTPLWGVGIVQNQLGGQASYLHDGRAKTLKEAILWHGGEAQKSKEAFEKLTEKEQQALITFLQSL